MYQAQAHCPLVNTYHLRKPLVGSFDRCYSKATIPLWFKVERTNKTPAAEVLKVRAARSGHGASGQFCQHIVLSTCVTVRAILNWIVSQIKVQIWKGGRPQATWSFKNRKKIYNGKEKHDCKWSQNNSPSWNATPTTLTKSISFLFQSNI